MDRHSPTLRPEGRNDGTQKWRDLLFVHWPVPAEAVAALLPPRLSLDLWQGVAYVGLVPFAMQDVAPSWLPDAMAFTFLECNLRTYVHLDGEAPGVWFFSLEAASWLAVQAARAGWNLPYYFARMQREEQEGAHHYRTERRSMPHALLDVRYRVGEALGPSQPDTLEYFLLERYLLYSLHRGRLFRGQVHHTPYPAHRAEVLALEESLFSAAGLPAAEGLPPLQHFSPGVDVEVFALEEV